MVVLRGRGGGGSVWVEGQSGLYIELQGIQDYTETPRLKKQTNKQAN